MQFEVFDSTRCELGEGPLWHPLRNELIWFDILAKRILRSDGTRLCVTALDRLVSAAGWVDRSNLVVADEFGLFKFNIDDETQTRICDIENDNPVTRSNDGRADPFGGFWIGTMGKNAEPGAGSIYRLYRGELRQLFADVTISNSICFSHDRKFAWFADTPTQKIMRVALDQDTGWPEGDAEIFVDLAARDLNPDGSVVDSSGHLWNAQWGAGRVARYAPDGRFVSEICFPASQVTCPAFAGDEGHTLVVTSAASGLTQDEAHAGKTFKIELDIDGPHEYQVVL